jgi:hypothetical protein
MTNITSVQPQLISLTNSRFIEPPQRREQLGCRRPHGLGWLWLSTRLSSGPLALTAYAIVPGGFYVFFRELLYTTCIP